MCTALWRSQPDLVHHHSSYDYVTTIFQVRKYFNCLRSYRRKIIDTVRSNKLQSYESFPLIPFIEECRNHPMKDATKWARLRSSIHYYIDLSFYEDQQTGTLKVNDRYEWY